MVDQNLLKQLNIDNLTSLWRKMGGEASSSRVFSQCQEWPYRVWLDWEQRVDVISSLEKSVVGLPENAVVSVWEDANQQSLIEVLSSTLSWRISFAQVAMVLALDNVTTVDSDVVSLQETKSIDDLSRWVLGASESFGYQISRPVIEKLMNDESIKLLFLERHGRMVATALLYKTGDVIGVHQVGVLPSERGQGIAYDLMLQVLSVCKEWEGLYVSLQASVMGLTLYEKLGFKRQFEVRNYIRG